MGLPDYRGSVRRGHPRPLANGWHHGGLYGDTFVDRVSLRDIGIRLPVVHFSLDSRRYKSDKTRITEVEGDARTMSTSSIRRASDDVARRRLTDVNEIDENTVPYYGNGSWSYDRKMSSGSVLSDGSRKSDDYRRMRSSDASSPEFYSDYWNRSGSEPRRASDASVVLTEDTDQFIIGDRVWVGGVKPGQIAYIGETQFAPGEWAGVVLDEPIGKNDGTVANIRYFQCEPKKGIFSRLTRLTRYPLVEGGAGEPAAPRPPSVEGQRKSNGTLFTSVPKKSSLVLSSPASSKNSVSKPPSPDSCHPNVQVGDRVIVKSSRGSKAGILRYLGTTDFAAGEWCGVELDDPLGKNDGSVSGTRYFECRPNFGLFAPLHKVSKSPANKRLSQGNCVIHNRSGTATPGIRRQGSKESLVSLSSTASTAASVRSTTRKIGVRTPTTPTSAKNALQETLKEKELHIEQLLKERDLERAEVTRAASQADEAERRLVVFRQEFEQHKEEAEARVSDLDAMVCLLRAENEELKNLLDDEKKKLEDLQFRFEEENIEKADIASMSAKYEEKMKMLENTLSEERKRTEALEQDSNKLFEAEEQMVILKDELDTTKEEISQLKKMVSAMEQEHISLEAHLTSSRAEVESLKIENETLKTSSSQEESKLREDQQKTHRAFEDCRLELEKKQKETEQLSREASAKEEAFAEKEKELHSKYLKIMNDLAEKHMSETRNLSKELENARNNSEEKLKLLQNQLEEKMKLCNTLECQLNESNILLSKHTAERSIEQCKEREIQSELENQLKQIREKSAQQRELFAEEKAKSEALLAEKVKLEGEVAEMQRLATLTNETTDKQVASLGEVVEKQKQQLQKAMEEFESKSRECEGLKEALTNLKKEGEARVQETEKLLTSEVEKLRGELAKQKEESELRNRETKQLFETNEETLKTRIKHLEDSETVRTKEAEELHRDLENAKRSLAAMENDYREEQTKNKNLTERIASVEGSYKKVAEEKDKVQLEASDAVRKADSLEEKLGQLITQKEKLESDIRNFMSTSHDSSLQLVKLNEDLRLKEKEMDGLREEFSEKTRNFERAEQVLKQTVEKLETEVKTSVEEMAKTKNDHQQEVEALKRKLEASAASSSTAELEWTEKVEKLKKDSETLAQNLREEIESMGKKAAESARKHDEEVKGLMTTQEELRTKLKEAETTAATCQTALELKIQNLQLERDNLQKILEETKTEFQNSEKQISENLKREAETFAVESDKLRNELKETNDKLTATYQELVREKEEKNKANEEKAKLEKAASSMREQLLELQAKHEELEMSAGSAESENKVLKDTINKLREEKCCLDKDSTEKMMQLTELRSQLEALEFFKQNREAVDDVRVRNLESEVSELREKLRKTEASHAEEVTEKTKQVAELKTQIDRLNEERRQMMSAGEKELENSNAIVRQLRKELDDSKFESDRKSEQMGKMEKQMHLMKEELESEKKKNEEYGNRLNASETERIDLKERFEQQSKLLVDRGEVDKKLEEAREKLSEAERRERETGNNAKLEKETLEKLLETTNTLLVQRENENKALVAEVESLKQEKGNYLSNNKILVEALQKEKAELLGQVEELRKSRGNETSNTNATGGGEQQQQQEEEEREYQKCQVDFLNSVIVDMQKKNDALKARIEILEMGFSPEDVDEFNLTSITTRSVAPRLFCDICDRFDLHDTEDCPTQANEDVPPPKSSKVKVLPPERPYCDICEVFGHNASECDDTEMF